MPPTWTRSRRCCAALAGAPAASCCERLRRHTGHAARHDHRGPRLVRLRGGVRPLRARGGHRPPGGAGRTQPDHALRRGDRPPGLAGRGRQPVGPHAGDRVGAGALPRRRSAHRRGDQRVPQRPVRGRPRDRGAGRGQRARDPGHQDVHGAAGGVRADRRGVGHAAVGGRRLGGRAGRGRARAGRPRAGRARRRARSATPHEMVCVARGLPDRRRAGGGAQAARGRRPAGRGLVGRRLPPRPDRGRPRRTCRCWPCAPPVPPPPTWPSWPGRLRTAAPPCSRLSDDPAADLPLPRSPGEPLAAIPAAVRAQQLALAVARRRGADPDSPAGLSKVTPTR